MQESFTDCTTRHIACFTLDTIRWCEDSYILSYMLGAEEKHRICWDDSLSP